MQKQNFSVALIAKNEEKTLPRLLDSLKEFQEKGGEVLLLDTGSTDKTAEVARERGCIVHEVGEKFVVTIDEEIATKINSSFQAESDGPIVNPGEKMFDYSGARNHIATFASNDVIAMPDCDEIYTKLDLDAINKNIEKGAEQLEYNFVFSHDADGHDLVKFTHCKFYNRKKMKWVGVIHEILKTTNGPVKKVFLEESVIKLEHFQNPATDRSHYLTGLAYDCYKDQKNDRNSHYFGRELFYKGFYHSAIKELKRHVDMMRWPTEASQSMIFIGDSYLALGMRGKAISWYARSIDLEPGRREALMRLADLSYKEKKVEQTIIWTAAALQVKGVDFYANYQPNYEYLPHEFMYWALWEKKEYLASKEHFDLCMAYQPFNPKYLHDFRFYYELPKMSIIVADNGKSDSIKRLHDSIKKLNYPSEKIEVLVFRNRYSGPTPKLLKTGVEQATGDWIIYVTDEAEFAPQSLMSAFKTVMDNRKRFMAFSMGEENSNEFFMVYKKLIEKLDGEIFDTELKCPEYYKKLLREKITRLGQWMVCGRAVVKNHAAKQAPCSEESLQKDQELYSVKKKKLETLEVTIKNNASPRKK